MSRVLRRIALPTAAFLMLGSLAACSNAAPTPDATANQLATSLQSLDFAGLSLAGADATTVSTELGEALAPLESIPRTVTLESVTEDEGSKDPKTATATLKTVWDIDASDTDWSYTTQGTLELNDESDSWELRYSPSWRSLA